MVRPSFATILKMLGLLQGLPAEQLTNAQLVAPSDIIESKISDCVGIGIRLSACLSLSLSVPQLLFLSLSVSRSLCLSVSQSLCFSVVWSLSLSISQLLWKIDAASFVIIPVHSYSYSHSPSTLMRSKELKISKFVPLISMILSQLLCL